VIDAIIPAWLDDPLDDAAPDFLAEPPDGERRRSELARVLEFRRLMRERAPRCMLEANANAGKRNPRQARLEGIVAGVFDYTVTWPLGGIAWVEFKGYSRAGRVGGLSLAQVAWGNRRARLGHHVACFYRPESALAWLRALGAPIGENWPGDAGNVPGQTTRFRRAPYAQRP
jgi:hypothetical protein